MGPSPRARGSRSRRSPRSRRRGSIPACAGKPVTGRSWLDFMRVHPRVRGEALYTDHKITSVTGPSPRARGSPGLASTCSVRPSPRARGSPLLMNGSIPACAGKPRRPTRSTMAGRSGSIPACAGKPHLRRSQPTHQGVHPRVRGEAFYQTWTPPYSTGPSPRARGSQVDRQARWHGDGSIPACAGKPRRTHTRRTRRGPSPRARGSRWTRSEYGYRQGSIPACAGKPSFALSRTKRCTRVHPRVRGEAELRLGIPNGQPGSIPACAGKPLGL